jgi:ATP-binding cassette subfamily B protein
MKAYLDDRDNERIRRTAASSDGASVLPELRTTWWGTGVRARAEAGVWTVFIELPTLLAGAVRISWRHPGAHREGPRRTRLGGCRAAGRRG